MREILEEYGEAMLCVVTGAVFMELLRRFLDIVCGF